MKSLWNFIMADGRKKIKGCEYQAENKLDDIFSHFECDRERRTDTGRRLAPCYAWRRGKMDCEL